MGDIFSSSRAAAHLTVSAAALAIALTGAPAWAQVTTAPPATTTPDPGQSVQEQEEEAANAARNPEEPAEQATDSGEIVVTGYAASLRKALNEKRASNSLIDVITAEDVGKFPDTNLAESLQRLPGITIERDSTGEGRTITVRGLGGDFVRTRLNGMETIASAGSQEGQSNINRTRGFDYNVFASDLFSKLTVRKSAEASVEEGSLGSTVDLNTGRPLDYDKLTLVVSVQDTYFENDERHNPRIAGMFSDTFFDGTLGFLISGAYQERDSQISVYDRNPGQFEFNYRGSDLAGPVRNGTGSSVRPTCSTTVNTVNATTNTSPLNCYYGFALGDRGPLTPAPSGVGQVANGIDANSLMFGSNPAAFSLLDANPTAIVPALVGLQQRRTQYERLGLTSTLQWEPTDRTRFTVDGLYAKFNQDNESRILSPFGLNRHGDQARASIGLTNTTTGLRPYVAGQSPSNYFVDRRAAYANVCNTTATLNCAGSLGDPTVGVLPTAQVWNGSSYISVPGVLGTTTFSTNPYNLDTYDYYNNPLSVGYNAARAAVDRRGIQFYDQLVGKEHVAVRDVNLNDANQADYIALDRVDWMTNNAYAENRSKFYQIDAIVDHEWSDNLTSQFLYGRSQSELSIDGGRTDVYGLDKNGYIFDEREGGDMPTFIPGFDVTNPLEYTGGELAKGYAGISRYFRYNKNRYQTARGDFLWSLAPEFELAFGLSWKKFNYEQREAGRSLAVIPTIAELNKYGRDKNLPQYANLTLGQMGSIVNWGAGLDVPEGTPTSWWSPDRQTFADVFGYECDCVNEFGDWRLNSDNGGTLFVQERDLAAYLQANYDVNVFGRPLRGNVGLRVAKTLLDSRSVSTTGVLAGQETTADNDYVDWLPSINLNYEPTDTLVLRFAAAKTMARPQLGNLAPGITSFSLGATPDSTGSIPRVTVGNPQLQPFRSTNYDAAVEWYFARDALISVAAFYKDLGSFPRSQTFQEKLDEFLSPEQYALIVAAAQLPAQQAYLNGENLWQVTSVNDSPGGFVKGIEVTYQQRLTFLPGFLSGFGLQGNFTHIKSELSFLTQTGVLAKAPWPFASPYTFNGTVFYERGPFEARVTYSWRDRFASSFPQSSGTCVPGLTTNNGGVCNAPFNDFAGTEAATYVDFKTSYAFGDHIKADLGIQNIFGETDRLWVYEPSVVRGYNAGAGTIYTFGLRFTL
ncbi:TonB-dependent receptor [Croceibacterium sp. TMG7-5b_MA50]|uniref:TonB-dependent receptor domain-containing protein n=1 Tax=Croceibacterium sp. TMG7-5b_MA50 TaxID=3121290 RepID=UPI0032218F8D